MPLKGKSFRQANFFFFFLCCFLLRPSFDECTCDRSIDKCNTPKFNIFSFDESTTPKRILFLCRLLLRSRLVCYICQKQEQLHVLFHWKAGRSHSRKSRGKWGSLLLLFFCDVFCTLTFNPPSLFLSQDKVSGVAKKIGAMWREMNDEEKAPYIKMAADDKVRYTAAFAAYKETDDYADHQAAVAAQKAE